MRPMLIDKVLYTNKSYHRSFNAVDQNSSMCGEQQLMPINRSNDRTQNLRSFQQDLVHPVRNLHLLHPFGYSFVLKVGVRTLPFTVKGSRGR